MAKSKRNSYQSVGMLTVKLIDNVLRYASDLYEIVDWGGINIKSILIVGSIDELSY